MQFWQLLPFFLLSNIMKQGPAYRWKASLLSVYTTFATVCTHGGKVLVRCEPEHLGKLLSQWLRHHSGLVNNKTFSTHENFSEFFSKNFFFNFFREFLYLKYFFENFFRNFFRKLIFKFFSNFFKTFFFEFFLIFSKKLILKAIFHKI